VKRENASEAAQNTTHETSGTSGALSPQQAEELLRRQERLQAEAHAVIADLDLVRVLSALGPLRQIGSAQLGLMVWRDIDFSVSSPQISSERAYESMRPLFVHPRVKAIRYFNETGPFHDQTPDERYYYAIVYQGEDGEEWKIDISFWRGQGIHPEPQDDLAGKLTPETRLALLWLKDIWRHLPSYRAQITSTDLYTAVLEHGVRTPDELDTYLAQHGKPTRAQSQNMTESKKRYE
jgi:hypothetical protein